MKQYYVYADSRNRPAGTFGNSYTLTLTTPVKNIKRVDLVAAKIPNSLYNITQPDSIAVNSNVLTVPPGFYSAVGLASALTYITGLTVNYAQNQGIFQFSSSNAFTLQPLTAEMTAATGITGPQGPSNVIASSNIINLITEEFVFLDIDELRNRTVIDAKTLVGETYGSTIATSFAMIPLDVFSGQFKTFKETTDYKMSVSFSQPLDSISRLTVRWLDKDGQQVNFNGLDINSFVLRFHCLEHEEPEEPEEPSEAVLLRRIQRAVEDAIPPPKPKRHYWIFVLAAVLMILFVVFKR